MNPMKTYDHKGKPLMTREEAEDAKALMWKRHGEKLIDTYWARRWEVPIYYKLRGIYIPHFTPDLVKSQNYEKKKAKVERMRAKVLKQEARVVKKLRTFK